MKLMIGFPDSTAFYPQMGEEIYLNYPEAKGYFDLIVEQTGTSIQSFYNDGQKNQKEYKELLVFVTSVAFYKLYKKIYEVQDETLFGYGTGLIAACVCAEKISFQTGIDLLNGKKIPEAMINLNDQSVISSKDGKKFEIGSSLCKELNNYQQHTMEKSSLEINEESCTILDVGPNQEIYNSCKNKAGVYYLDNPSDSNYILENFQYKKFNNNSYFVKRLLGLATATQNYNEESDSSSQETIMNYYKQLKKNSDSKVDNQLKIESVQLLKKIIQIKQVSSTEMNERYQDLVAETMIKI